MFGQAFAAYPIWKGTSVMKEMNRKNQHFTDSVIRRMTRIALDVGAINLAQGFPDFDPPKALTDRLAEVSALGPHQYPITMGAPNFRQALARKCERFMGRKIDPNTEMVVTIGSTEAMVDTIFALTNPGDKVVLFSPYFENYHAQIIMADCEPIYVPLVPPAFHFDPAVLEDAFKQNPKAILICNPSNPSGKVFTEAELKYIADLCIKYDVYAIMDEVYEHIVYPGHKHTYMNSIPGMWSVPFPALPCPRPTPSPAGVWAMPSLLSTSWTASSSTMTSTPWAPPRP